MQSKTSFFNITLFRKNLTRFWPLWGGATFLGCLLPLALFLQLLHDGHPWSEDPAFITATYYDAVAYALPVISLLYAILCAMAVWSYLYNARSTGLMHTLPITRRSLFATNFLSGMAMMLIPYAVTGLLCVLGSLAAGGFQAAGLLYTVLSVLGESFFYFASATLAAFVTGNVFALPAVYFLLHFLVPLLDWLLSLFAGNFLFGMSSSYSGAADFLSPTVYLLDQIQVNRTYEEVTRQVTDGVRYYTYTILAAAELENFWLIGVYALVGAALLALAYVLYTRRRSEAAGDVVAVGWMKPLFRFGVAALAALLGGLALYDLFWYGIGFQEGRYYETLPMVICMLVAGAVGYYAASMLLAKSLRVFRGSWKGLLLVAAGCAALCCVLRFDLLGVSRRVPEAGEVTSVTLYAADNTYTLYPGEDGQLVEQVRTLHQAIVEDQEYIRAWQDERFERYDITAGGDEESGLTSTYIRLTYNLADGLHVQRRYTLPLTRERLAREGTYDNLLDRLINSEDMKAKRLHAGDERYSLTGGSLWLDYRGESLDLSSREVAAILDAVAQDAAEGSWGEYDWFDQGEYSAYAMHLELCFSYADDVDEGWTSSDWIRITVRPGMDHTVACLKELDLVEDGDLVTYEQMDDGDLVTYEQMDEYDSIGVIGGADGPAEVFVTGG